MQRTSIELEDEQLQALERLAAEQASVADLVRRAFDQYLNQSREDDAAWSARFAALLERVQGRIPAGISPEEIEADITAASAEVRRGRRAAHGR